MLQAASRAHAESAAGDLAARIEQLRAERLTRARLPYRDRLAAFEALSDALLSGAAARVLPAAGAAFAAAFLRATNLEHLVSREVAHPAAFDRFVPIGDRKRLRLVPQGLACHWIAGNVPLLGLFSWALSAVAGNINVIRTSSRAGDFVSPVVDLLRVSSDPGRQIADDTLVVSFPREDDAAHRAMSAAADVRVAWGGREAVEAVMSLPARWSCETIVLGPRMSLAVVDPALATERVMRRLATDTVFFDQQACSSPQWLFVKGSRDSAAFTACVEQFTRAFEAQATAFPRHRLDPGETYRIGVDRARVLLDGGTLHRDAETAWTVAVLDAPDERLACMNRVVQIVPFADVTEVVARIPSNVQTVVTLLDAADVERFSELAAHRGVCRFPRPGEGNHFETPWDGIPLMSRLTRWVIRTDGPGSQTSEEPLS